jgi:hypothetical protein
VNLEYTAAVIGLGKIGASYPSEGVPRTHTAAYLNHPKVNLVAAIDDYLWSDVFLPTLTDSDLYKANKAYPSQIKYLLTDNFSKGFAHYADRWSASLQFLRD